MRVTRLSGIPSELWEEAARARRRLLLLDYDGTLAPFRVERGEARPVPGVLRWIEEGARSGRTQYAIVSGRPIAEIDRFLPGVPAHLVGEHGWEVRLRKKPLLLHPLPPGAERALARAARACERAWLGGRIERKRTALVLHVRSVERKERGRLQRAFVRIGEEDAVSEFLSLTKTDGGLELRVTGRDKGTAVRELLRVSPAGALPVCVGDDDTDEDAFRVVRSIGFGVRVDRVGGRPTSAVGRLRSCADVRAFLAFWARHVEGVRSRAGSEAAAAEEPVSGSP